MIIDLQITNERRYPLDEKRLFGVVERVLVGANHDSPVQRIEVSLLVVDKDEMADYNLRYHETEGPTDVLSFPYTDPESQTSDVAFVTPPEVGVVLGDLIVCYPIAEEEAVKQGKTTQDMLDFYVDHGLHHLLGHHHD